MRIHSACSEDEEKLPELRALLHAELLEIYIEQNAQTDDIKQCIVESLQKKVEKRSKYSSN